MLNEKDSAVRKEVNTPVEEEEKAPLIGTWFSLGILGLVIFGTYILMFWFYFDRY
ncbi:MULTISPECIES: hypothetical protein [Bacillaceae]|uniref:Cytochrome c oxidase subunit 2A n=1 Tax=Evansella alkalicola TaxID=745819 RepID=A0ABS6JX76_9BACI|nr:MULTISPECIES: hypothetical protein [Bacillaceae]MBU9722995.1 hypothetical protein [Bacillus alkalicola]